MNPEEVESLKQQLTDQFVSVNSDRPELARFRGLTGRVKTVNMNGRALVEFDVYVKNIGWFDIAPDFLTIVAAPAATQVEASRTTAARPKSEAPKTAAPPVAKAPAPTSGEKKLSPLELARRQGAVGGSAPKTTKPQGGPADKPVAQASATQTIRYVTPAPPDSMKNQPPRVLDRKSLTAADILEMSQGKMPKPHQTMRLGAGESTPTASMPQESVSTEPVLPAAGPTQAAVPTVNASAASTAPEKGTSTGNPSTADILAACRSAKQD